MRARRLFLASCLALIATSMAFSIRADIIPALKTDFGLTDTQMGQIDSNALSTTAYRERLRHAMPYAVQLAVQRRCGDQVTTLPDGSLVSVLPPSCTLGLDGRVVALAVSRLQAAKLNEDLTRHVGDIDQRLAGFERIRRLAHENRLYLQRMESR